MNAEEVSRIVQGRSKEEEGVTRMKERRGEMSDEEEGEIRRNDRHVGRSNEEERAA